MKLPNDLCFGQFSSILEYRTSSKFSVVSPPVCSLKTSYPPVCSSKNWSNCTPCGAAPTRCLALVVLLDLFQGEVLNVFVPLLSRVGTRTASGSADTSRSGWSRASSLNKPGQGHSLHLAPCLGLDGQHHRG